MPSDLTDLFSPDFLMLGNAETWIITVLPGQRRIKGDHHLQRLWTPARLFCANYHALNDRFIEPEKLMH